MKDSKQYRIVSLTAENVKRIEAVTIAPDGNVVVIGGNNGHGKSSLLDSIYYALVGKKAMPPKPVRDGEEKATITLDLGEFVVVRTIRDSGTHSLKILTPDGATYTSPQQKLDAIVSELSFDPVRFMAQDAKAQAKSMRALLGLNFEAQDAERKNLFEGRTALNRDLSRIKGTLESMTFDAEVGVGIIDIGELLDEQAKAQEAGLKKAQTAQALDQRRDLLGQLKEQHRNLLDEIARTEERIKAGEEQVEQHIRMLESIVVPDTQEIRQKIDDARTANEIAKNNERYNELVVERDDVAVQAKSLTDAIAEIDKQKAEALATAEYPVPGLGLDDDGVTYNGLPLSQASSAEQLRVCAAIGAALNPSLKFLTIRDGSLLDSDAMNVLREFADQRDIQVWIERVGDGDKGAIIIENGAVKEASN